MVSTQEDKIIIIARLQAYLAEVSKESHLREACEEISKRIHHLMNETASGLETKPIHELLAEFKTFAADEPVLMIDALLVEKRVKRIQALRQQAVELKQLLDLSEYYKKYDRIPVENFNWSPVADQLAKIVDAFGSTGNHYDHLISLSQEFFNHSGRKSRKPLMPKLTDRIIRKLITRGHVSSMDAGDLIDDISRIRQFTIQQSRQNREMLVSGNLSVAEFIKLGHDAYAFLEEYWVSDHLKKKMAVGPYLIAWDGPGKASFLKKFAEMLPSEKNFELCLACTGIHPEKSKTAWVSGVDLEMQKDAAGFEQVNKMIQENRFIYEYAYISSFEGCLENPLSRRWRTVFESIVSAKANDIIALKKQPPDLPVFRETPVFIQAHSEAKIPARPEEGTGVFVTDGSDTDIDELSATDKKMSIEDEIVRDQSTWNKYLKPFLSENLLGILGAGLLMLAWLCISIWIWNKGQYYRLLTGALPMYLTSIALAYISRFFYKHLDKGVSPRAPALFASLCVLSIPFNYLIALSMFYLEKTMGPAAGIGLGILYTVTLIFLAGRWIKDSIGFHPGLYLSIINAALFLPAVSIYSGLQVLPVMINIILFTTFFMFSYQIYAALKKDPPRHRYRYLLFGGNYLLTVFICCVYYRIIPGFGSMAVLIQLAAISMVLLGPKDATYLKIILTSALSVLGIMISFKSLLPLSPLCVLLSMSLWLLHKKRFRAAWMDEVISAHIFLCLISVVFEIKPLLMPTNNLLISGIIFSLIMSLVLSVMYEKKYASSGIQSISYLVIAILASLPVPVFMGMVTGWTGFLYLLGSMMIIGAYGYKRYSKQYQRTLWFLNLLIMQILPATGLILMKQFDAALMSFAVIALCWNLISIRLHDALAHTYKTAISLFLPVWAWIGFILSCMVFYFDPPRLNVLVIISFACLFTSLGLAAKKTMSQIPVYMIFALTGVIGLIVYRLTGIQMKAGLGTGLASLGCLYASHILNKHEFWQKKAPATIFSHMLPLSSRAFLYFPFELAGWIFALIAIIKACFHYEMLNSGPGYFSFSGFKILLTLSVVMFIFSYFVRQHKLARSGYIILLPAVLIFASISSYIPLMFLPVWMVIFLFLYDYFARTVQIDGNYEAALKVPLNQTNTFLNHAGVVAGFACYLYFIVLIPETSWNRYLLFISIAMWIGYMHQTLVARGKQVFSHLVPFHILILVSLGFILFRQPGVMNPVYYQSFSTFLNMLGRDVMAMILWSCLILCIPGFLFETSKNKLARNYSDVFHFWLFVLACGYGVFMSVVFIAAVLTPLPPGFKTSVVVFLMVGYGLLHIGNRYYKTLFLYGFKACMCCFAGILISRDPLRGLVAGATVFTLLETLLYLAVKTGLGRIMESGKGAVDYLYRLAGASVIFVFAALLLHFSEWAFTIQMPPHHLLYLLIPYTVFSYRKHNKPYLGYLAVGIFAYANGFMSMNFHHLFIRYNLNTSHLLSTSAVFTILIFLIFNKISLSFRKEGAI